MTSVAVISSAAASIQCLKDQHQESGRWPNEADEMLKDLEGMKEVLVAAYDRGAKTEAAEQSMKEVVRLSYEIVDAVADSLKPPSSRILDQLARTSAGTKIRDLHEKLKGLREEIAKTDDASPATSNEASVPALGRKNSGRGKIYKQYFLPKVKKKSKPEGSEAGSAASSEIAITGSETKRENAAVFDLLKAELLKAELLEKPPKESSREVYIVGESGMGKSTLASKLYNDSEIRRSFDVFGWVTMERSFQIKRVLQLLLKQLGTGQRLEEQSELSEMNEIELISLIFDVIKDNKSYLLVLDDIGAVEDWNSIRPALPLTLPKDNLTRVIITTSSTEFVSLPRCYTVSGLTLPETRALLEKEASFESGSEEVGRAIYEVSGGSPLYATILGKSLKSEAKDENLAKDLLRSYESKKGTPQVLEACYKRLAPRLKPCLLYLGQFPPGEDIEFEKLYLLLAAEKLILPQEGSEASPEECLRDCLHELARLNLVRVEEDVLSRSGAYKSCRIHKQVGEFCKSMGSNEEFFQVVELEQQAVGRHTRRLAINYRGGSSIRFEVDNTEKNIKSLLIFDPIEGGGPWEINWLEDFFRLRVLSFNEIDFRRRKLPKVLGKLLLLRLLSFRGCILEELPSSLRKLTQLETLDLLVRDECNVIVPGNIFDGMNRMVHLFLPSSLFQGNEEQPKLTLRRSTMLETLVNFNTNIFEVEDLSKLEKLKILSTISNGENSKEMDAVIDLLNSRKEKLQHSSMEIRDFDCYDEGCVSALKKLLQCTFVHSVSIEGQMEELPEEEDGERSVADMVLIGSELEDDPMPYFGKFQNLRSLELADDAYIGTEILISSSSSSPLFPKLRTLKLRNLVDLEKLTIEEGALPQLSSLQIASCGDALELTIPKELYHRLTNDIGGDAYSVVPSPSKLNICKNGELVQGKNGEKRVKSGEDDEGVVAGESS